MSVLAHHPETGADLVVTEEQLNHHMRLSGWVLRSEHDATQAAQAAAETAAAAKKTPKDEGK